MHFNPRPPCGGRHNRLTENEFNESNFNPRPPCGGRLVDNYGHDEDEQISIHVPRVEDDSELPRRNTHTSAFQSTSPVWRTTAALLLSLFLLPLYFNPRPPCGGRLSPIDLDSPEEVISIHVPRVEDDNDRKRQKIPVDGISIHVPRVEDD